MQKYSEVYKSVYAKLGQIYTLKHDKARAAYDALVAKPGSVAAPAFEFKESIQSLCGSETFKAISSHFSAAIGNEEDFKSFVIFTKVLGLDRSKFKIEHHPINNDGTEDKTAAVV